MALTISSRVTQGNTWSPSPSLAPRPNRVDVAIPWTSRASGWSTSPKRVITTRTPASAAGSVAASQSAATPARKVSPGPTSSVSGSSAGWWP